MKQPIKQNNTWTFYYLKKEIFAWNFPICDECFVSIESFIIKTCDPKNRDSTHLQAFLYRYDFNNPDRVPTNFKKKKNLNVFFSRA